MVLIDAFPFPGGTTAGIVPCSISRVNGEEPARFLESGVGIYLEYMPIVPHPQVFPPVSAKAYF